MQEYRAEYSIYIIILFAGIIAGCILVNLIPFSWVQGMNIWGSGYIRSFLGKSIRYSTMFNYLFRLRGQVILGIYILLFSPFIKKTLYCIAAYLGTAWGMVSSIILMEHGTPGLRICFFLIFPHYIFYGMGIYMVAYKMLQIQKQGKKRRDLTLAVVVILGLLTVLAGIMAEAYVNTEVFGKILQNY